VIKGSIQALNVPATTAGNFSLRAIVSNHSGHTWESTGPTPVQISCHWLDEDWNMVVFEGKKTPLPAGGLLPSAFREVEVHIDPPPSPGHHHLCLTLVREAVCWFETTDSFRPHIFQVDCGENTLSAADPLRVLFFLEPVVYNEPSFLVAHLHWVAMFARALHDGSGAFALAANAAVISQWKQCFAQFAMRSCSFALDSDSPLKPFNGDRRLYSRALYGQKAPDNPLIEKLTAIRSSYRPNLIVYTSQSSFAQAAFSGIANLNIEQAPLPRAGHPQRTCFDPSGHQVGSLLECHAEQIRRLPLPEGSKAKLERLHLGIRRHLRQLLPEDSEIAKHLAQLRASTKIALLVTQPPDWVTYEGAFDSMPLEDLIACWAGELPSGWIGMPTYHPGYRLSEEMERALANSCSKVQFLPRDWSQGKTEALLLYVDGIVTLTSTVAMTGILLRQKVVVTGKSPFQAWAAHSPQDIESAPVLSRKELLSLLAFLTSDYAWPDSMLRDDPSILTELMLKAKTGSVHEWLAPTSSERRQHKAVFSFIDRTVVSTQCQGINT
jgi:hypothetical protein